MKVPTPYWLLVEEWVERADDAEDDDNEVVVVVVSAVRCGTMEETKIIYHIDDEETPYLVKLSISPERVTLADFKNVLNRPNYKYFFKSMDDDFGWVSIIYPSYTYT